jgi:UDP:flavonoid glycosyltransferase YjiC (YdhE family)
MLNIAYFISPHGFGHASRSVSVMQTILQRNPEVHFQIYTLIPEWFFSDTLPACFTLHRVRSDVGLIQRTPLEEDLPATLAALREFFPFKETVLMELSNSLKNTNCACAICDISPLGIAVAQQAGVPSILVENFTWDWIYEGYLSLQPELMETIPGLQSVFRQADYHFQTRPFCQADPYANLITHPVSRAPKNSAQQTRLRLGITDSKPMVLITMGGIPEKYSALEKLRGFQDCWFVLPGSSDSHQVRDNLILLPHRSQFYHPDLVNASQTVIGKLGYSTISEVYHAGIPFGFIPRENFRESPLLAEYVEKNFQSLCILEKDFYAGNWLISLPTLLSAPRIIRQVPNGAEQICEFIFNNVFAC